MFMETFISSITSISSYSTFPPFFFLFVGNSLRDSLDDFYSIQVPTIETGVIESNFPSSANSPRKMNPVHQVYS